MNASCCFLGDFLFNLLQLSSVQEKPQNPSVLPGDRKKNSIKKKMLATAAVIHLFALYNL